jgi:hypothetical protein
VQPRSDKDEISREEFLAAVKDFFLDVEETELSNVLYMENCCLADYDKQ